MSIIKSKDSETSIVDLNDSDTSIVSVNDSDNSIVKYDDSDIEVVYDDIDRIKRKYSMYIGYSNTAGFMHLIKEILQNCIDETKVKGSKCDEILIDYDERLKRVTIIDNGRGIPHGKLIECATVLHSSGKFTKGGKNSYNIAAGMNGVGLTCTNALSYICEIVSIRDGKRLAVSFEKGHVASNILIDAPKTKSGTAVSFIPNEDILGDIDLTAEAAMNLLETMAYLSSVKTKVHISKKNGKEVNKLIHHPKGIADLLDDIVINPLIKPIRFTSSIEDKTVDIMMTYVSDFKTGLHISHNDKEFILSYANFCTTIEGGTHVKGFTQGINKVLPKFVKDNYLTKQDKDLNILPEDIREGLVVIINIGHTEARFIGQMKEKLENLDCVDFVRDVVSKGLNKWVKESPKESERLGKYIKDMAKVRTNASAEKKSVVKNNDITNALSGEKPKGYTTATGKVGLELWIVEGPSAAGSMAQGRDKTFQEIFELKGVTKNTLDLPIAKILENDEIRGLVEVIGTNIGRKFDASKCRYENIIIATDADADGDKITSGLLTFFHEHMYELIEAGIIIKVVPPLYKIKKGKKEIYIDNAADYAKYVRKEIAGNMELYHLNGNNKGDKLSPKEIETLIQVSLEYSRKLNQYSRRLVCDRVLLELCVSNCDDLIKLKLNKFEKQLKELSEFMYIVNKGKNPIISGLLNKETQHIELNKTTMSYIKGLNSIINTYLGGEFKYYIDGVGKVPLCKVLDVFKEYEPAHKQRYKGLGEMKSTQLWETTMDPEKRTVIRPTTNNREKEMEQLRVLHSGKEKYRLERKKLMTKFKLDRDEIST